MVLPAIGPPHFSLSSDSANSRSFSFVLFAVRLFLGLHFGYSLSARKREKKRVSISAKLCLQYSLDSTSHPTSKYFLAGFFHYQVLFQKVLLIIQSCCLKVLVKGGRCNMLANPTALFKFIAALYIGHVSYSNGKLSGGWQRATQRALIQLLLYSFPPP